MILIQPKLRGSDCLIGAREMLLDCADADAEFAGDHSLRLGLLHDDFVKTLAPEQLYQPKANKFISSVNFIGPFASAKVKPSRQRLLSCDPETGDSCVRSILSALAQRAYRRSVSEAEVTQLTKFVDQARADGQSVEQGLALALQAVLVSPHFLFHVERDAALHEGQDAVVVGLVDRR